MSDNSSATVLIAPVLPRPSALPAGLGWGLLGVLAFSLTVPLTRIAVGGLSPLFIGSGRAVLAGLLAALALTLTRQRLPRGSQWARLAVVAAGVVLGFPLLTSYALTSVDAAHGAVVIALLPAATATVAVLRGRERPPRLFWCFAALGTVVTLGFVAQQGGGLGGFARADLLLLGAVIAAAVAYAEGGLLSRELGSWQTVSWALVLALPVMIGLAALAVAQETPTASLAEWTSFVYLGVVSMYLGFFAWYRGLATGPIAQVSQVQLVQPVLSLGWAALLLGEQLTAATLVGALAVVASAGSAVRARGVRSPLPSRAPSPRRPGESAAAAGAAPCVGTR
ncbi:DMT family transporter [Nocardioides sp.]|uniref:DMT family transporter n=1 Tax=Nocardioides sp. TaxID=35761 RepID=UPI002B26C357|nr:DMT family transporter [Nocardioides sp.]